MIRRLQLSLFALFFTGCAQSPDSLVERNGFGQVSATIKNGAASDLPRERLPVDVTIFRDVTTFVGLRPQTSRSELLGGAAECQIENDVFKVRFVTPAVVDLPILDEVELVCDVYYSNQKITKRRLLRPTLHKFNFSNEERLSYAGRRESIGLGPGVLIMVSADEPFEGSAGSIPPEVTKSIEASLAKGAAPE